MPNGSRTLRTLLAGPGPTVAPLVLNALMARLAEQAGFGALYLGGGAMGYLTTVTEANLSLPDMDGVEVCRAIREFSDAYVVMITARNDEVDRLIGLETGADDFLGKPFSPRELKARVNAMFRRPRRGEPVAAAADAGEVLRHGELTVDVDGRRALWGETELALTRTEFDLLTELMRTPARVWSREALLRSVWGNEWVNDTHLVEVHIGNLRRKLTDATDGAKLIRTVRGVGYRMEAL